MGYGSMQGIQMIASSPVRHDSPLNLHGLEVTQYQPPWVNFYLFFYICIRNVDDNSKFLLKTEGAL